MTKFSYSSVLALLVIGCSSAQTPGGRVASSPSAEPPAPAPQVLGTQNSEPEPSAVAESSPGTPTPAEPEKLAVMPANECQEGASCLPPPEFARAVCKGNYPGLAIALFEKSTPWQRRYVKVESIAPVNTYGGATSSERLQFTEEVLLLRKQGADAGGIVVSGASDVDVLRWDGTCVTVREEYLSVHRMPTIKNATINWRYLDDTIREGLLQAKYVSIRYDQQRKACRGSSASNPSSTCAQATEKLNDAITVAVRGGLALPAPEKLPRWKSPDEVRSASLTP